MPDCAPEAEEAEAAIGWRVAALLGICGVLGACGEEGAAGEPASSSHTAPPARASEPPPYDRVVLVTLDTLRADHLPSYGYARDTAPFLARLAADGVLFENALATVSHTAPSHATMLTGVPPRVHGVRRNGNKLAGPSVSLPELLRERGFGSAAFLGANFLSGITGDFDHVSAAAPTTPQQIDRAIEWARARGGRPSFLWLHLYDPHRWKRPKLPAWAREAVVDSRPRESGSFFDYVSRLHGLTAAGPAGQRRLHWWGADGHGQKYSERSREEVLEFIDDYDGLIRFADSEIQRLYEALAGEASPGRTLWIVTCDHGEGLGSHRYEGHGGRIYNEQLRVALLFHATDGSLTPRRVTELVGHMDLLPTLAELFGLDWRAPHEEHFGRSLVPVLRGTGALPERLLFAEQRRAEDAEAGDAGEIVAIQDLRHKLIQNPDGSEEFFALDDDPLELRELADPGRRRDELRAALEQRLEFFSGLSTRKLEEPAPEFLEELQDLGYAR